MKTSSTLELGTIYSRADLKSQYAIKDATINNGIFKPKTHDSVWLFVTEDKTSDRTPYNDGFHGDDLFMDGQSSGRTDTLIMSHEQENIELLLFYRRRKYEYSNAGFRYEGPFRFVDFVGEKPRHFHLKRVRSNR